MEKKSKNGVMWLQFSLLCEVPGLCHGIFLRHGGCSEGRFASLNASISVGDCLERVTENRRRMQEIWQEECQHREVCLVWGQAIHGTQIAQVTSHSPSQVNQVDGLMTLAKGRALMMTHADCQVALFYDPIRQAIATVHSGWRGSVANIYGKTVSHMQEAFHTHPSDLLVCISPSLGPEAAEFRHYQAEFPEEYWQFQVRPTYFDLWAMSEWQLQQAGVLSHHIEVSRISTYSQPLDYFSYRRENITGRNATGIMMI